MKEVNGWAFPDIDEFMAGEMKADGTYQASHLRLALKHVTDLGVAVDGGAHVGTWSRLMARAFGQVIALEPSADTHECLVENMRRFGCPNVEVRQVALGAVAGLSAMVLDGPQLERKNTGGRYVAPASAKGDRTVRVETLDSWSLPSLGFLKLDVEGSEPLALMGARATLARCRPIVLFESKGLCRRYGLKPAAAQDVLASCGYRELEIAGCDRVWGPR
ncbi:MAG: FkbM family methyltransferase [Pseudomonadota bacterium]